MVLTGPQCASGSPRGLIKTNCWASSPRVSDSVDPGEGLGICISNKLPGDAAAAAGSLGTTL